VVEVSGSKPAPKGTHKPDSGNCGGKVSNASCEGCGADNIKASNVKKK
jgi:hypothetical protein